MPKLPMSASKLVKLLLLSWMFVLASAPAMAADQKSGFGLGFEKMQKIWQGISNAPKMTTCRLANKTVYKGKQICVYKGANKTILGVYNMAGDFCSTAMDCRYDPGGTKTIASLVKAFKDAEDK